MARGGLIATIRLEFREGYLLTFQTVGTVKQSYFRVVSSVSSGRHDAASRRFPIKLPVGYENLIKSGRDMCW